MIKEIEYTKQVDKEHIKSYGQYFTQYSVAHFMCSWACENANNMLDPAVGNSVFLTETKKLYPSCNLYGYEKDKTILSFFGNPASANIENTDYLLNDWNTKYDAIVCNPPYNKFQAIPNRTEIINSIYEHTGVKYSGYTNLYILFLIKSIYQLANNGRLAYIIPSEFLNSKYGILVKELLIKNKLLKAIINFKNDDELFFNATTTCCILLLDYSEKNEVLFYNLSSVNSLKGLIIGDSSGSFLSVSYNNINATEKWRVYLKQEEQINYKNLIDVSNFCRISRGIATGANDFFCFSNSKIKENQIPEESILKCICHSSDITKTIFTTEDFKLLSDADKTVYLLDIKNKNGHEAALSDYIAKGEAKKINKKYLLSCRDPWYSMEQKPIAPIWVSSACRSGIKFVRNLANVNSLTTFHSIFVNEPYEKYIDIIFCYFLTPIAQSIIRKNRKELGNGLEKFQPSDLKNAKMLNISLLTEDDFKQITEIYHEMHTNYNPKQIDTLNRIFSTYLIP